jgi:hypothetical protein
MPVSRQLEGTTQGGRSGERRRHQRFSAREPVCSGPGQHEWRHRPAHHFGDGSVHGRARLHDRQRGIALDPTRPACRDDDSAVAGERLCRHLWRVLAARRPARRPVRPGEAVPDRTLRLRPCQHRRRTGRRAETVDRLESRPGHRRLAARSGRAFSARYELAGRKAAQPCPRGVRGGCLGWLCRRRRARRPARRGELAGRVPATP